MHVSPAEVSEKDLRYLFSTLDSDGGGAVEIGVDAAVVFPGRGSEASGRLLVDSRVPTLTRAL